MSDELALRKRTERGAQAKALLESPVYREAFERFEADLMKLWENLPMAASHERERIWLAVKTARTVQNAIATVVSDGKISQRELDLLLGRKAA